MSSAGRRIVGCALVAAASGLAPAAASAEVTRIALVDGALEIRGSDGADEVSVSAGSKSVVIDDPGGVPAAEAPCKSGPPSSVVRCPRNSVDEVVVDVGDGDDLFDGDGDVRYQVDGDRDDDELHGGDARDLLEGKFGDDAITGGGGGDELVGGLDDDDLSGQGGADVLDGGPGTDRGTGGGGKDRCAGIEKPQKGACERNTQGRLRPSQRIGSPPVCELRARRAAGSRLHSARPRSSA